MDHLKQALAWLGAGAKTASGYGHMSFDEQDTLWRRQQAESRAEGARARAKLASMTPGQRAMDEVAQHLAKDEAAKQREPGGNCKRLLREASEQAQAWPMEERRALLELAQRVLRHHDGEMEEEGQAQSALSKDSAAFRIAPRLFFKRPIIQSGSLRSELSSVTGLRWTGV